jgi:hypothetical protein
MSIIQSVVNRIGDVVNLFFDEPEVARYLTFDETLSGVALPDPETGINDRHFTHIDAPGLINGSLPVIFFTTRHEGRPTFQIRLNSTILIRYTFEDDGLRTWHKFIPRNALKTQTNELVLSQSGEGKVIFADMFIIYRSNELTVRKPIVHEVHDL